MKTSQLKKFAQFARRSLIEQVSAKIKLVLAEDSNARRENPKAVEEIEKAISHQGKAVSNQPSVISKSKETTDDWRLAADGSKTDGLIEKVAYTWFNRFCALRFMDVNRYTRIGVVSPAEGQSQPEILAEAKMGYIDDGMVPEKIRQQIFALLDGSAPSQDPQSEAYRLLVVAICNYWYKAMPFLFERIDDYTELLMPDDLLSGNSILAYMREAISLVAVSNQLSVISKDKNDNLEVEVIGWLYQFYISEKKDEVFAGLKKNRKITPENIPAATQLFTPHWIVRYLVENSVGRLWMLNRPDSKLIEQMDYYIRPETSHQPSVVSNQKDLTDDCKLTADGSASIHAEQDFLKIHSPEEIRICDPACGSGHMLTYAFDLLYSIYEEEGYEPSEIPEKILTHNLFGIEIDERAGELAAFALTMKARSKQRRFFRKQIQPNICVLEKIEEGTTDEHGWTQIIDELSATGVNQEDLIHDLRLFAEVDNFGSLLRPRLEASDFEKLIKTAQQMLQEHLSDAFMNPLIHRCIKALKQAHYLSPKYHVVIANPPYMGGKGMNGRLAKWAKDNYPNSKSDLFAMFIERGLEMVPKLGYSAMVTMQSWMFLSSYEKLRIRLMAQTSIESMAHMANMVMGIAFGTAATIWKRGGNPDSRGAFCFVESEDIGKGNKPFEFPPQNERNKGAFDQSEDNGFYRASTTNFKKIPGSPIAYWVSEQVRHVFSEGSVLKQIGDTRQGMATSDNNRFLRVWSEVSFEKAYLNATTRNEVAESGKKWFPYNKGGDFRKWYGNSEFFVNWEHDGKELLGYAASLYGSPTRTIKSISEYFKPCVSWSKISSGNLAMRYYPAGHLFDVAGCCIFSPSNNDLLFLLGYSNTIMVRRFLASISPTINFEAGQIASLPILDLDKKQFSEHPKELIEIAKHDWNSSETSWDFINLPLLQSVYRQPTLKDTDQKLRAHWEKMTLEMQRLEVENNHIFIDAYGLQDELTADVPLKEITLTCNPHYRYGGNKSEEELEVLLLADTMKEFISYAVGCMFGRYSLDAPGLILANQGDGIDDYYRKINEPQIDTDKHRLENNKKNICVNPCSSVVQILFPADDDNVIPILDGDWFTDDITERFFKFLRVTFGEEHYEENLDFIETAIGKSIRNYFLKHFYNDHVKRYKKRPIYWLFSSPKGSFNALIYMHRYRSDTVSVVLNDYLREFRTKLTSRKNQLEALSISASAKKIEKTRALKEIEKINKMIDELDEYEREVLYPLATEQVEIDLDDGVKVNYNKFGKALKKIPGLTAKGN